MTGCDDQKIIKKICEFIITYNCIVERVSGFYTQETDQDILTDGSEYLDKRIRSLKNRIGIDGGKYLW